jgi:ABC-type branched-subunit amino acid transport system substrate-binding protein
LLSTSTESNRSAARAQGVTIGVEECARSAALFGGRVTLMRSSDSAAISRAGHASTDIIAVIGGETSGDSAALSAACARADVLNVNALCADDALRGPSCDRHTLHVAPSDTMLRDAREEWAHSSEGAPEPPDVVAWHASLEAFGADTLNQRFRVRFATSMNGDSWAGWFAVKSLSEAVLRARPTSTRSLIKYLESERASADGHKGRPLSFRAWDHQLRQPLYVVGRANGRLKVLAEVPAIQRGVDAPRASRDVLDAVGVSESNTLCHWVGGTG